ncbi:MAG: RNA methyltransferase [Synechococcaceae cyanobacterium]|nr:RNA methyltransferase [Synechococcaceae cyanobacterium]
MPYWRVDWTRPTVLLLEGTHLLQEALRLGLNPEVLLATPSWLADHRELTAELPPGTPIRPATPEVLAAAATTRHPDGVLLTVRPPAPLPPARGAGFLLALDRLQDPGNLGTLLRTALAAGVQRAWLAEGADPWQPKVLRASSGAALALPLERMAARELPGRLEQARREGHQVVATVVPGAAPRSGAAAVPYWRVDWTRPTVLLLGNEGAGLDPELAVLADHRVTIPHAPEVESLNVAVAAAPLLLERRRQTIERAAAP